MSPPSRPPPDTPGGGRAVPAGTGTDPDPRVEDNFSNEDIDFFPVFTKGMNEVITKNFLTADRGELYRPGGGGKFRRDTRPPVGLARVRRARVLGPGGGRPGR